MTHNPYFSIITVCLNSEKTLARTIDSIRNQTFRNLEYVVNDGGSTDSTLTNFVDCGRKVFQNEDLRFFNTIEEAITTTYPNVVLISSVLQYIENYEQLLLEILAERIPVVILDRVSINLTNIDTIYLQIVPSSIYSASYPCFMISESKLLYRFEQNGYNLLEDFDSLNFPELQSINALNKGYIFRLVV